MNIKDRVVTAYQSLVSQGIEVDATVEDFTLRNLFVAMFNCIPNAYDTKHPMFYGKRAVDMKGTIAKMETNPTAHDIAFFYHDADIVIVAETMIIYIKDGDNIALLTTNVCKSIDDLPAIITANIILKDEEEHGAKYNYITQGSYGFEVIDLTTKPCEINLADNYNDSLPHDKIVEFLSKDNDSGLIILHGDPGTGKTTYIRHLISAVDKEFFVIDQNMFSCLGSSSFINLLLKHKNSIFVLEDCESMLTDRISGNTKLSSLLNMTDGIIGDAFNFKFICTFNTALTNIDKALLRKGRMKLKYEFGPLTADKTAGLAKTLNVDVPEGSELTLTEIYNFDDETYENAKSRKIGFSAPSDSSVNSGKKHYFSKTQVAADRQKKEESNG